MAELIPKAAPLSSSAAGLFTTDTERWEAVQSRNPISDGFFVYGVRTTHIFCRPICKARLARRANVTFYDTAVLAAVSGFRPCKRCRPELEGFMPEEAAVRKIRAFVTLRQSRQQMRTAQSHGGVSAYGDVEAAADPAHTQGAGDDEATLSLGQMARQTGLSKWHFHRVFKRCVGVTPVEYLRMERAAAKLDAEQQSMQQVSPMPQWDDVDGVLDPRLLDGSTSGTDEMGTDASSLWDNGGGSTPLSFDDVFDWPEEEDSLGYDYGQGYSKQA